MEEDVPAGVAPATRRKTRQTPYERKKPAPVDVNYRMAYVGTISFHDAAGSLCLRAQREAFSRTTSPSMMSRSQLWTSEAKNIPFGTVVQLTLTPETGLAVTVSSTPLAGTLALSSATATVTIPHGFSRFRVRAEWTP